MYWSCKHNRIKLCNVCLCDNAKKGNHSEPCVICDSAKDIIYFRQCTAESLDFLLF